MAEEREASPDLCRHPAIDRKHGERDEDGHHERHDDDGERAHRRPDEDDRDGGEEPDHDRPESPGERGLAFAPVVFIAHTRDRVSGRQGRHEARRLCCAVAVSAENGTRSSSFPTPARRSAGVRQSAVSLEPRLPGREASGC